MINLWTEIWQQFENSEAKLSDFIENAGLSASQVNRFKKFLCEWTKLKKKAEIFEEHIAPLEPYKVEHPFSQDDFRHTWKIWKEYLQEQHSKLMKSRWEQMSLNHLAEISENNSDLAISYLRYAMARGAQNFFKVDEKQKMGQPKTSKDEGYY